MSGPTGCFTITIVIVPFRFHCAPLVPHIVGMRQVACRRVIGVQATGSSSYTRPNICGGDTLLSFHLTRIFPRATNKSRRIKLFRGNQCVHQRVHRGMAPITCYSTRRPIAHSKITRDSFYRPPNERLRPTNLIRLRHFGAAFAFMGKFIIIVGTGQFRLRVRSRWLRVAAH